ncbi:MAG: auracyanin family protein [Saprospiraceae bacterium]|nr:auracyanin family protein [Saprospiraceae bacterium]
MVVKMVRTKLCCCWSILFMILYVQTAFGQEAIGLAQSAYYSISAMPIPEDVQLEVGGLTFNAEKDLVVCTRRGEVWHIKNPSSSAPVFTRIAHGLHEPLGIAYRGGAYYTTQRAELTKLVDLDDDLKIDRYECVRSWGLAGNYHEYSYGPEFLPNGDMLLTLNLGWIGGGASLSEWRGWMIKVSPNGEMHPFAAGMRSPAGFGFNAGGDIFYTENQGDWVGSGRMTHLELGDFAGHPESLKWTDRSESPIDLTPADIDDAKGWSLYEYGQKVEAVKAPSVWFPHTLMGISTSDLVVIPEGFGPFTGQLLVGDQGHSKLMRVFQEKINGVYQGVCFPFRDGFSSGILRLEWGEDQTLFVGMTNRGWASTGKDPFGIERLKWTGMVTFEMQRINIASDGFEIHFTEEVDRISASDPTSYSITDFTYKYHHLYGSPAINTEQRTVYKVELAQDGKSAHLYVEGLRKGYINEVRLKNIKSSRGKALLHTVGYYTINEIPGSEQNTHQQHQKGEPIVEIDIRSSKRITSIPDSWNNVVDQTVTIGTKPGMLYDTEEVRVRAGSKIKWVFNNPDDMMHNLLIVHPGSADQVAAEAINLGLLGQEKGYIPNSDLVLFHTNLLVPGASDIIYFQAPTISGAYPFVCTFPGHATFMRGVIQVTPQK